MQHCVLVYLCIYFVIFIIRLGSACRHVAAVLFKLQACVQLDMDKKACTSKLCQCVEKKDASSAITTNFI